MAARPKGGLGKGLSALIPGADEKADSAEPQQITPTDIEVARIHARPDQPRSHFDPDALAELVSSVKSQGVLVPLLVTPREQGGYTLIAGERRLRAARAADLIAVPCRVIEGLSEEQILEISIVENVQREDLNPIELALGYRRLIDELGYTQQQVAERVGKERATVANTVRLLALPELLRTMLEEDQISSGHARALLAITSPGEQVKLARRIVEEGLTVRDIERLAAASKRTQGDDEQKGKAEPSADARRNEIAARNLAEELEDELDIKVKIAHKGPGGTLSLRYTSLEELDQLVALLKSGG